MKKIITIQHTQSIHHTNGMVGSWTDWDLSALGMEQAVRIGKRLKEEIKEDKYVMYASDLLRAKHTAEIIGKQINIQPIITEELRERNLGKAVGKSVAWLRENMECLEKTIEDKMFSDGESRKEVWERLLPFYRKIMESEDENLIIVSHGDTLSIFHAIWLGLNMDQLNFCNLHGAAGGVSKMHQDNQGRHVLSRLSDMSYIKT
ncbi:histidine phosphatase family protein [Isachenkonia alkalipeptolytica]|uniref:Histidine phosphatase family protein n=1 Tax=Isachenkonia alkalipeptolytica TaxID=2565777 RepID=A0AA44BCZ5_9CLOT|nr:histidine phosphatase family protein [Isachenkonia alkalipeptolytica]NBG87839.1 histidine phosphatase family protein [Isachenkonia alkalipeptolytica]